MPVANAGAIAGSHIGVYLAVGTVSNSGSIAGANYAIQSNGTGSALITNLPGGVLQGGIAVAAGASSAVSVSNGGTITGSTFGISLQDVGSVTNAAGAVILGGKLAPVGTVYSAIYLGNGEIGRAHV